MVVVIVCVIVGFVGAGAATLIHAEEGPGPPM